MDLIVPPCPLPTAIAVAVCSQCRGAVQVPAGYDIKDVADDLTCWCWLPRSTSQHLWVRATLAPPKAFDHIAWGQRRTAQVKAWRRANALALVT